MRRYQERIEVEIDRRDTPVRIVWRDRTYLVECVLDRWRWAGKWWLSGRTQRRTYFRIEVSLASRYQLPYRPRTFEVYRKGEQWTLASVYD